MDSLLVQRESTGHLRRRHRLINDDELIHRLGVSDTLESHQGCVNTLKWNQGGTLLVSGSDDRTVKIWGVDGSLRHTINTGHVANVFGAEFLPYSGDTVIASCAGDCMCKLHDINRDNGEDMITWTASDRVKQLATAQDEPYLFWSAAEDGHIRQYDTRSSREISIINCSLSGNSVVDSSEHVKTLSICQGRTELIACGLSDVTTPIYDRRNTRRPLLVVADSGRVACNEDEYLFTTYVAFDYYGRELIVNQSGSNLYVFNLYDLDQPTVLSKLDRVLSDTSEQPGPRPKMTSRVFEERKKGVDFIRKRQYSKAITVLNNALYQFTDVSAYDRAALHTARSGLFLIRRWAGDTYSAVRDTVEALLLYPGHAKALFRLCQALLNLEQLTLAKQCIDLYKKRFPDDVGAIEKLNDELNTKRDDIVEHSLRNPSIDHIDYSERYTGHSNNKTDCKEANFFGSQNQFIVGGSDCGSLLVWSRKTGSILSAYKADEDILNIAQPHPEKFLIATSGIEDVVRFWEPLPEDQEPIDNPDLAGHKLTEEEMAINFGSAVHSTREHFFTSFMRDQIRRHRIHIGHSGDGDGDEEFPVIFPILMYLSELF